MFSENECLLRLILSFITYKDVYEKIESGFYPVDDVKMFRACGAAIKSECIDLIKLYPFPLFSSSPGFALPIVAIPLPKIDFKLATLS